MLRYCSSSKQTEGVCVPQNASVKGDWDKANPELVFPDCRKGQRNLGKVGGLQGCEVFSHPFWSLSHHPPKAQPVPQPRAATQNMECGWIKVLLLSNSRMQTPSCRDCRQRRVSICILETPALPLTSLRWFQLSERRYRQFSSNTVGTTYLYILPCLHDETCHSISFTDIFALHPVHLPCDSTVALRPGEAVTTGKLSSAHNRAVRLYQQLGFSGHQDITFAEAVKAESIQILAGPQFCHDWRIFGS